LTIHNHEINDRLLGEWLGKMAESAPKRTVNGEGVLWKSEGEPGCQFWSGPTWGQWVFSGESAHLCRQHFWERLADVAHDLGPRCRNASGVVSGELNITRIDIAMDQYDGSVLPVRFPMDMQARCFESGHDEVIRPWTKTEKFVQSGVGRLVRLGGHVPGARPVEGPFDLVNVTDETLYIGARESEALYRCYDMRGPLRHEFELKGGRAITSAWELLSRFRGGGTIGELAREMFIGLAVEKLPGFAWSKLGEGMAVNPVPPTAWDLVAAVDSLVRAYGPLYISICDSGNAPAFLRECRRRLDRMHRTTRWRQERSLKAMVAAGSDLWARVAYQGLDGAEMAAEVDRVIEAA
jgi:hypothetical protein